MPTPTRKLRLTVLACVATIAAMLGLGFAAKPLYDAFCRATGFGGTTQVAQAAPGAPIAREVEIRFDTNVAPGAPLEFSAAETRTSLRLGETAVAFFRVANVSDEPVEIVATYNVAPHNVAIYFNKLQCFCFNESTLAPGESLELPVMYFLDPAMADDPDLGSVRSVTLSYTYFRAAGSAPTGRLAALGEALDAR